MAFELLIIAAPRILEDPLLETLLEHPATEFFGSVPFRGHGARPEHLSVHEQVAGWRREVRVEVLVRKGDVVRAGLSVVARIRKDFSE